MSSHENHVRASQICHAQPDSQLTVSVIMGVYNCQGTVDSAVQSLLDQSYTNWELVVCDDGSTDGTYSILKRLSDAHPTRIVLLRNTKNKRLSASLNRCLRHSSGALIARMDADDVSAPSRLARQVDFLLSHSDVDLVGTAMQRFGGVGSGSKVEAPPRPDRYASRARSPFCHATIMTYARVYQQLGGYDESERADRVEDVDLWFRFFEAGFVGRNLTEPLYFVREDGNSIARRTFRNRWNLLCVTYQGYIRLRYPAWWYYLPLLQFLKVLVPRAAIQRYRSRQALSVESDVS